MGRRRHKFRDTDIEHGWWFYRARCSCGWLSPRRWRPEKAEADLMVHEKQEAR